MENLARIIGQHPLLKDLPLPYLETLVGCARNVVFQEGQMIFREGEPADTFYLIRHGEVALELYVPHRGPVTIEKLGEGSILGWSWLFPPYRWQFDARALTLTRAIAMDGRCVREKAEQDHELGYHLMKRFAPIMVGRLQSTRMRLLDLYQNPYSGPKR